MKIDSTSSFWKPILNTEYQIIGDIKNECEMMPALESLRAFIDSFTQQ